MGLRQQQDLLARLYTETELFERFTAEPERAAREFDLSGDEARDLAAIAEAEMKWFADSLYWKRLREVEKLLPTSSRLIGEQFGALFRNFSGTFNPISVKKHLEDALAFAEWLVDRSRVDAVAADVLKFETARLRHHGEGKRLTIAGLAHDVRPLCDLGRPGSEGEIRPRRSLAVWVSFSGRTRFYFL